MPSSILFRQCHQVNLTNKFSLGIAIASKKFHNDLYSIFNWKSKIYNNDVIVESLAVDLTMVPFESEIVDFELAGK